MKPQRRKAKRVREVWHLLRLTPGGMYAAACGARLGSARADIRWVTCLRCKPPKPFVTVRYGKLTPAQKKRNYEQAMKRALGEK